MKSFKYFLQESETLTSDVDIIEFLDKLNIEYEIEKDYITFDVKSKKELENIIGQIHDEIDYDVYANGERIDDDQIDVDDDDEVDIDDVKDDDDFTIVIYLYNTDDDSKKLDEAKRTIRVNARGKRRIKMVCRRGFKWSNNKCVKISGKERLIKKRAIRKSVRTKKAKGKGYARRSARLRNRAMKKRRGMTKRR